MPAKVAARSLYAVHPSVAYARAIVGNLKSKTGRSLEEWCRLLASDGPAGEAARRDWLRKRHQLGMTTAWMIAQLSVGKGAEGVDADAYLAAAPGYVERMYAGRKAALRPIHDALVALGRGLARDVKICPCETMVPLYRTHVFAQIRPATLTRIDFGLALKGAPRRPAARLLATGGLEKGDRITHCFRLTSPAGVDAEVEKWLKVAYELDR